jgi:hypothetical protein
MFCSIGGRVALQVIRLYRENVLHLERHRRKEHV